MSVTAATLGGPKIASAPSLLNTQPVLAESLAFCFSVSVLLVLENAPVCSEALLNKPVGCVLLGVLAVRGLPFTAKTNSQQAQPAVTS